MRKENLNDQAERRQFLCAIISSLEKRLRKAPAGRLRISVTRGCCRYYQIAKGDKGSGKYLNLSSMETIRALAQKDYDLKALESARRELRLLEQSGTPKNIPVEDVFDTLSAERQRLVIPIVETDREYVANWLAEMYEPMGFKPDDPEIYTQSGLRVRSKTERLFVDTLASMGIPFKYEPPVYLSGGAKVRPDLSVLNVRKKKEIYIEILGMMDDPAYAESALRKIRLYASSNIFVGDRLITCMESKKLPLNAEDIIRTINHYLL